MKIGFYECEITPPLDSFMPGYYEDRRGMTIYEKLYAKAVAIGDGSNTAIMINFDACMFPDDIHDPVTERVHRFTGVPASNIAITVNHCHTGGPLVGMPQANVRRDEAYTDITFRRIADAAIMAYRNMVDARAFYGSTDVEGISFNRTHELTNGRYITHGCGRPDLARDLAGVDPQLQFVMAEADGKKIGAIVNYALHPDNLGIVEQRGFSGDFPSVIAQKLKEAYGPDFVSVFLLGACGDINDLDPSKEVDWSASRLAHRKLGAVLADAIVQTAQEALEKISGSVQCLKETITVSRRVMDNKQVQDFLKGLCENGFNTSIAGNLLAYQMYDIPKTMELHIQAIGVGDVCFGFTPGEMFVNYGLQFKAQSKFKHNVFVELANSACGYVASEELFVPQSDLYETSLSPYTNTEPQAGPKMVAKLLELSDKLYQA